MTFEVCYSSETQVFTFTRDGRDPVFLRPDELAYKFSTPGVLAFFETARRNPGKTIVWKEKGEV